MLTHLHISEFAIAKHLDLELRPGMTSITGETGAGKSIMLDALGYALGNRADASVVRPGARNADISASFELTHLPAVQLWLKDQSLDQDDECVIRRVITAEGRSRAFINGRPVPLQQLRELGQQLLDIHSQHEHHSLLKRDVQRNMLDEYGGHQSLLQKIRSTWRSWNQLSQQIRSLQQNQEEKNARAQLLRYQTEELDNLSLQEGELEQLEQEQTLLANAEQTIHTLNQVIQLCEGSDDQPGLQQGLRQILQQLGNVQTSSLDEARETFTSAEIQLGEGFRCVQDFISGFEVDEQRLQDVDQRLASIYDLARKHHVNASELLATHQHLIRELEDIEGEEVSLEQWQQELQQHEQAYFRLAEQLSARRQKAAKKFARAVTVQLQNLSMKGASFEVALTPAGENRISPYGQEETEFMIQTNSGLGFGPIQKIASGGELSRVSLAIQVISAESSQIPTLIFDEVDVGISGATSEIVGRMLRHLGDKGQVICVTHQPQVASLGHQHLQVRKKTARNETFVEIQHLNDPDRVDELARLLGGIELTDRTLEHAREMLHKGQQAH